MCHYVDWFVSSHMALCLLQASSPTMFYICLSGTYADFPAEILTDPTKFNLTLSTQFSCTHNVPCSIRSIYEISQVTCSSPIIVPTDGGWFHSQLLFKIMYLFQVDMHLGMIGSRHVSLILCMGGICQPLQVTLDNLPVGH
jgi:hypothetical protein